MQLIAIKNYFISPASHITIIYFSEICDNHKKKDDGHWLQRLSNWAAMYLVHCYISVLFSGCWNIDYQTRPEKYSCAIKVNYPDSPAWNHLLCLWSARTLCQRNEGHDWSESHLFHLRCFLTKINNKKGFGQNLAFFLWYRYCSRNVCLGV